MKTSRFVMAVVAFALAGCGVRGAPHPPRADPQPPPAVDGGTLPNEGSN